MRKQSGLVPIDEVVSGLDDELVLAIRNDSPQARHSFTVADQVDRLVSASETDPDREPVCEPHDSTGEPGAGNRPAGFGERGEETCPWESACGPAAKAPDEPPTPLPATRLPSTLHQSGRYPEVGEQFGCSATDSVHQQAVRGGCMRRSLVDSTSRPLAVF